MSEPKPTWQQQFSPSGQTRDCIHGHLARSCNVCELEHEIFDLKLERDEARRKQDLNFQLAAEAQTELDKVRKVCDEFANAVKEYQYANMAKGMRILLTEDETDKEALESAKKIPDEKELMSWKLKASKQMRIAMDNYSTLPHVKAKGTNENS